MYHDTRHIQSSDTGLLPVCTKAPNLKMYLCTYESSVHNRCASFDIIVLYTLCTSICVCVCSPCLQARKYLYVSLCTLYTRRKNLPERDTPGRSRGMLLLNESRAKEQSTNHSHDAEVRRRASNAEGRPTVRVPQGGRWRDAARQSRALPAGAAFLVLALIPRV